MTHDEALAAIQQSLAELEATSFVAHRDTRSALPAIERFGAGAAATWVRACHTLFLHDRDAGKAFIRGSAAAAEAAQAVLPWTEQALAFTRWRGAWRAIDGFMEQLPAAYGLLGTAGEVRWAQMGLDWCGRHLESGVSYFRTPVARLAGGAGIAGIEALLAPSVDLFEARRLALATYLPGAIRVRDLLGVEAVLPWAKRGADVLQAGRARGEAYFRLESEESLATLLEHLPGFRLVGHTRFFQLLLAAWFDERFELAEGDWTPDRGHAFVETDGAALYLPAAMGGGREEAILALLHTAGHLVFHSYERSHIERLFAEAGMTHPPLDADQRITWRPLFARYGEDMVRFQLIFDLCEDLRVDVRIAQRVPNYFRRLLAAAARAGEPEGAAGTYFRLARDLLGLAAGQGQGVQALAHAWWSQLAPLLTPGATVVDAFRIANALYADTSLPPLTLAERAAAFLPGRSPNAARPVYPRRALERAEASRGLLDRDEVLANPALRPNPECRDISKAAAGEDPDFDIPPQETAGSGGRVGVGLPQPAHVLGHPRGHRVNEKGVAYPEWDYRDGRYKRNWAWVQERRLEERDEAEAARLLAVHGAALKRLTRAIQAQKPARMAPLRRQMEGDELDLEAVTGFVAERRAGRAPKPAIYRQRAVRQRDTAVLLLADLSTSIMQTAPKGDGRVVDRIRAGLLLFATAMEAVGDPYAIAGFASKYRDAVSYYPIKEFDQRLNGEVRATLGGLSGRLATRMGAAIRHAVRRFEASPSARRLLLLLSDGRPADYDDGGDERYLHEDTRMAVKEAVDAGVHPFCVTLDTAGSAYLPQIFGPGHYRVVDRVDDLPRVLPEIYLRLRR